MKRVALGVSENFSELCSHMMKFKQLSCMRLLAAPMPCVIYAVFPASNARSLPACMLCILLPSLKAREQERGCTEWMQTDPLH